MASGGDELSMPEGDDITISPQGISRRVLEGLTVQLEYFTLKIYL